MYDKFKVSYRRICKNCRIARSNFYRWVDRIRRNRAPVYPPGPGKLGPPVEVKRIRKELSGLPNKNKRTLGTGELYDKYKESISRRDFQDLVVEVRDEIKQKRRESQKQVICLVPGVIWSMDGTYAGKDIFGYKHDMHVVKDLCSTYNFPPSCSRNISGHQVAAQLEDLFQKYNPPLVMKRDNKTPEDCQVVNRVLEK